MLKPRLLSESIKWEASSGRGGVQRVRTSSPQWKGVVVPQASSGLGLSSHHLGTCKTFSRVQWLKGVITMWTDSNTQTTYLPTSHILSTDRNVPMESTERERSWSSPGMPDPECLQQQGSLWPSWSVPSRHWGGAPHRDQLYGLAGHLGGITPWNTSWKKQELFYRSYRHVV